MEIAYKNISNIIYGGLDGIITTVAIIAGSLGTKTNMKVAFILAVANVLADGFSMAVSSYESILENEYPYHNLYRGLFTFIAFIIAGFIPLLFFVWILSQKKPNLLFTEKYIKIIAILTIIGISIIAVIKAHFQEQRIPGHLERSKGERAKIKAEIIAQTVITCVIAASISYFVSHNLTNYFE